VEDVNSHLSAYRFNDAASSVYQFVWHEFCDWYIEMSKPVLFQGSDAERSATADCLLYVFGKVLQMLHPFMPFVTEELWRSMYSDESLMVSDFPQGLPRFEDAERRMGYVIDAVSAVRSIRGELNIAPALELSVVIRTFADEAESALAENAATVAKLTRSKDLRVGADAVRAKGSALSVRSGMEVYVPLEGVIDVAAELQRLGKELAKTEESLASLGRKLDNAEFIRGAPKDVVAKEQGKCEELTKKKARLIENLDLLKSVS
jgi:valyl-tRNA synthetase